MELRTHRCRVDTTVDGADYSSPPWYVVMCETCGTVGFPHDEMADARAIANRHEDVAGFERFGRGVEA